MNCVNVALPNNSHMTV